MTENSGSRAADPAAAANALVQEIAAEDSATAACGQAARTRLIEVIRQTPEPKAEVTGLDMRRWQANGRRRDAAHWLQHIPDHPLHVAAVIGVTPRAVTYWRRGERAPRVKHWQRLRSLYALCRRDLWGPAL